MNWDGSGKPGPTPVHAPPQLLAWPTSRERLKKFLSTQVLSRLVEYSQFSSVHGLRYIGDQSLHPVERLFWVIASLLALASSAYFISNLFIKFDVMPVIMSLSPQSTTIKDFPFPSITVCNMNHMRRTEAERILNQTSEDADLEQKLIYDFCESDRAAHEADLNISADWDYIKKFMVRVTQPCHELLITCLWHGDAMNCNDLFNPSLTDEGMCCVFNRLNRELIFHNPKDVSDLNVTFPFDSVDWSPERGYPPNIPLDNLPRRARGSGTHLGLSIVIDAEVAEYYCSSENGKGFKVILNNPIETPKVSSFGMSIGPGQESKVVIVPHMMTATSQLEGVAISKRLCYFESERRLSFYRTYTQRSCVLECEANFTLTFCGCVLYHMPKSKNTRICGKIDRLCAHEAQRTMELSMSLNEAEMNFTQLPAKKAKKLSACRCLPGCNELSYGFVISAAPVTNHLVVRSTIRPDQRTYNFTYFKNNIAIVHFFFMERQFSGTVRGVLYGFTDFLSNAGGLLGLFLGFSFMSLIEMVYFITLRVWFHLQKYKNDPEKKPIPTNTVFTGFYNKNAFPFNQ